MSGAPEGTAPAEFLVPEEEIVEQIDEIAERIRGGLIVGIVLLVLGIFLIPFLIGIFVILISIYLIYASRGVDKVVTGTKYILTNRRAIVLKPGELGQLVVKCSCDLSEATPSIRPPDTWSNASSSPQEPPPTHLEKGDIIFTQGGKVVCEFKGVTNPEKYMRVIDAIKKGASGITSQGEAQGVA